MNTAVVSYSFSGNNDKLAAAIASKLGAAHIRVMTAEKYEMCNVVADMVFNRTPKVSTDPSVLAQYDRIIVMAPIWMGKAAAPIRAYLKWLKASSIPYGYVTLSGGSMGTNPGILKDVKRRAGRLPFGIATYYIAKLLPAKTKPTPEQVGAFRLSDELADQLAQAFTDELREKIS